MTRQTALFASSLLSMSPLVVQAQVAPPSPPADTAAVMPDQATDRQRAIGCLATAIAYEAGHEPIEGQQAVAEVILNRLRYAGFPKSICGIVFSGSTRRTGCQFSFTCDGSLNRRLSTAVTERTRSVATAALDGRNPVRVPGATHFHADYVSPYWAPSLIRIAKIGAHIFYRGAGARDADGRSRHYVPFGNSELQDAGGAVGISERKALPAEGRTPPQRPGSFAPWGLPTQE
jgi:hypothetical protein